jgi:hypothetical protein
MDTIASLFPGSPAPSRDTYHSGGTYEGVFSRAPASYTDGAYFTLPAIDSHAGEFGPCPWPVRTYELLETGDAYPSTPDIITRHLLPAVGDRCFVTFVGEGNDPIIVLWWPVGRSFEETRV